MGRDGLRGFRYLVYKMGQEIRAGHLGSFGPHTGWFKGEGRTGHEESQRSLSRDRWRRVHDGWTSGQQHQEVWGLDEKAGASGQPLCEN